MDREQRPALFTVHRASTDVDWLQATALLYDYVEWIRSRTDIDPLAAHPQLQADLSWLADHYATEDAALYLGAWQGSRSASSRSRRARRKRRTETDVRATDRTRPRHRRSTDRLIDVVIADATERQCHTVWLETVRGAMDPAIAVCRRNGFAESATRPPTLSVDGVIVMERLLSAGDPMRVLTDVLVAGAQPARDGSMTQPGRDPSAATPAFAVPLRATRPPEGTWSGSVGSGMLASMRLRTRSTGRERPRVVRGASVWVRRLACCSCSGWPGTGHRRRGCSASAATSQRCGGAAVARRSASSSSR